MVFLDVAVVALVLGRLLGGRLSALAELTIRGKALGFAAIALQLVAFPSELLPWSTPTTVARALWLGSYLLLITMLLLNARLIGLLLVAGGLACNLTAIVANGGLMPVRGAALRAAGRSYHIHNNSIELTRPRLALLVDRWAAPRWLPLANVYSIGDLLIAAGTVLTIVVAMRGQTGKRTLPRDSPAGAAALGVASLVLPSTRQP
jgi:hypothetical protein